MRFVVGLGNPGERYRRTRHNLGFRVVDQLAARAVDVEARVQAGAWVAEARLGSEPVLLVKPLSYMNLSGLPDDLAAFVLADFPNEDLDLVEEVVARAADATACLATDGAAAAMNQFNAPFQRRPPTEL